MKIEHHETCKEAWKMLVELHSEEQLPYCFSADRLGNEIRKKDNVKRCVLKGVLLNGSRDQGILFRLLKKKYFNLNTAS